MPRMLDFFYILFVRYGQSNVARSGLLNLSFKVIWTGDVLHCISLDAHCDKKNHFTQSWYVFEKDKRMQCLQQSSNQVPLLYFLSLTLKQTRDIFYKCTIQIISTTACMLCTRFLARSLSPSHGIVILSLTQERTKNKHTEVHTVTIPSPPFLSCLPAP